MNLHRFDIVVEISHPDAIEYRECPDGQFVEGETAQALYDALEAYTLMSDAPPAIVEKGRSALAKARGES